MALKASLEDCPPISYILCRYRFVAIPFHEWINQFWSFIMKKDRRGERRKEFLLHEVCAVDPMTWNISLPRLVFLVLVNHAFSIRLV